MRKWLGDIILENNVEKMIKWFTLNWDKEIGAFGSGKVTKDGELYIEKLHFPTQEVSAGSVDFEPEDWGKMVSEMTLEELGKIIFYWHKHPNNSVGHSHTDEEETFERIMDTDLKRKLFGFAQSSKKSDGSIDWEARIELRKPIFGTIEANITTYEDLKIEENCKKILNEKIKKPKPVPTTTQNFNIGQINSSRDFDNTRIIPPVPKCNSFDYGKSDTTTKIKMTDLIIPVERMMYYKQNNGRIEVFVGCDMENVFQKAMTKDNFKNVVRSFKTQRSSDKYKYYIIEPAKKSFQKLVTEMENLNNSYEKWAQKQLENSLETLSEKMSDDEYSNFSLAIYEFPVEEFFEEVKR